jgi:tetratricopeptide (TPR) repeat protein
VLQDLGKPEEAIAAFRKSLELHPNNPYPYDQLMLSALDELRRGDVTGALELMEWMYGVKKDAKVANNIGLTHRDRTHDYRKALDWYLKASELAPRDVDILNDTGLIYQYHMGNPDKALEFYEKVLKIARNDHRGEIEMGQPPRGYGDALENMGLIYIERKQWDKAKEVLDELLGYYPSRPVAKRLRSRIPE